MAQVQALAYSPDRKPAQETARRRLSPEQFQSELDYYRARTILQKMRCKGLISESEYRQIDRLNRGSFSPLLASLME
jgi:hypothetical protein